MAYLDVFGWIAVMGGALLLLRALLFGGRLGSGEAAPGKRRVGLTPKGKRDLFLGLLLLIVGHVLKDVIPSLVRNLSGG